MGRKESQRQRTALLNLGSGLVVFLEYATLNLGNDLEIGIARTEEITVTHFFSGCEMGHIRIRRGAFLRL